MVQKPSKENTGEYGELPRNDGNVTRGGDMRGITGRARKRGDDAARGVGEESLGKIFDMYRMSYKYQ
jgi:hypothetical protein